jgi:hypothetical protein
MLTRILALGTRYRDADQRQLALFPEWERLLWMERLPAMGAALGLAALFAIGTPAHVVEHAVRLSEPVAETEPAESTDATDQEYDLAAIPDHIKSASQRYRLPEQLITAVISVESNFDHAAVSRKGARGLMQLMPQTSALIGVRDPHSPEQNIDAGASHLRAMLDTFNNDLPLALAAYNAGEQSVVRYHGIPPYPETRRFVARVLNKMGDQQAAARVMAKPIPAPQWLSRAPRPRTQITVQTVSSSPARPIMVPVPAPRPARSTPVMAQDPDARDASRSWRPAAPPSAADTFSGPPAPTTPLAQSP